MSFKTVICWYCHHPNEFYQEANLVPECPVCGAGCNGSAPDKNCAKRLAEKKEKVK